MDSLQDFQKRLAKQGQKIYLPPPQKKLTIFKGWGNFWCKSLSNIYRVKEKYVY